MKKENLKIATILDKFSYECWKYEAQLIQIDPHTWKKTLIKESPKFLLVESAWKGNDGTWRNKVAYREKFKDTTLIKVIEQCRRMGIKTVFWNKEDPLFFDYFIETAKLFDFVFTTDEGCVEKYKRLLKHNKVYVLPFAAQPKLHNPIDRQRNWMGHVAFTGSWYSNALRRIQEMEAILKPAFKFDLHIYDRNYNNTLNNFFKYPDVFQPFIKGNIPYEKISNVYKNYSVFLNVNLVHDSTTMFSRRIFELLACGASVISSFSPGIECMFPEIVKLCQTEEEVEKNLDILINNKEIRDRLSLQGVRKVVRENTYKHRLDEILKIIGTSTFILEQERVAVIAFVDSIIGIDNTINNFLRQKYTEKELLIIVDSVNSELISTAKEKEKIYGNIQVFNKEKTQTLGEYLDIATYNKGYSYLTCFNENMYYGSEFISDLLDTFKYTDADIVGKSSYFTFFQNENILAIYNPGFENQYVNSLCDTAFLMKTSCYEDLGSKLTILSIDDLLRVCKDKGKKLYSADRYNFVSTRCDSKLETQNNWVEKFRNYEIVMYTEDYELHVSV